jgi:molecular chaperone GrpE (heat shock protein)
VNDLSYEKQREISAENADTLQDDETDMAIAGQPNTQPEEVEQSCVDDVNAESTQDKNEEASELTGNSAPENEQESLEALIKAGVAQIRGDFEDKLAYDASKQLQVDRLHSELQEARQDQIKRATHPYIQGVIQLYDILDRQIRALKKKPEKLTPERYFSLLEDLQEDIVVLLERYGVVAFQETGETFNPRRQSAHKKVPAANDEIVGSIVESIRPGFEQGEEILIKERVSVYVMGSTHPIPSELETDKSRPSPSENVEGE